MPPFKFPFSFLAGTKAKAEEVNANFEAAEEEINDGLRPGLLLAGDIKATARAAAPEGWLLCEGQAVSRTTYKALFEAIGTTYGTGDGATTFNVPDLRGRVPVGVDGAANRLSENDTLGKSGGHKNMPSHSHGVGSIDDTFEGSHQHHMGSWLSIGLAAGGTVLELLRNSGNGAGTTFTATHEHDFSGKTANEGSGPSGGDDRMQPFQIVNFMVKT